MEKKSRTLDILQNMLGSVGGHLLYDFLTRQWLFWVTGTIASGVVQFVFSNPTATIVVLAASIIVSVAVIAYRYATLRIGSATAPQLTFATRTGKFLSLTLSSSNISFYDEVFSPYGMTLVKGVPVQIHPYVEGGNRIIGHVVVRVGPNKDGSAGHNQIICDIKGVKRLFVVWTAGNGWETWDNVQFAGKRIGSLQLNFADGETQSIPVILGKNIREWIFRNPSPQKVVSTLIGPNIDQFWESINGQRTLDLIQIDITNGPKDLRSITMIGEFETPTKLSGEFLPHFQISAVTCKVA